MKPNFDHRNDSVKSAENLRSRSVGNMSKNMYAKFRSAPLRIKKALGIFRELITTRRTIRVAFGTRLPGPKNNKDRDKLYN